MRERFPQHYAMTALGFCTGPRPSSLRPLRRQGVRSAVCFVGLTGTSVLLFIDLAVVLDKDLSLLRAAISASSMAVLALALAWSSRSP